MVLQEQIAEIIFRHMSFEKDEIPGAISEIEMLISSACMKQREICQNVYKESEDEFGIAKLILNAPLPSEVEICYSGKEVLEIIKSTLKENSYGYSDESVIEIIMNEFIKNL